MPGGNTQDILADCRGLMVIAPHQDDELLLAAGLLRRAVKRGITADVVMATNGDCGCRDFSKGRTRLRESLAGLALIGVPAEHFHILGYADTGMPEADSFLTHLYRERDPGRVFSSAAGSRTYGLEEKPEYHVDRFGCHGAYSRETFCEDLRTLLLEKRPDCIVTTSPWDVHGDHSALFRFVRELLREFVRKTDKDEDTEVAENRKKQRGQEKQEQQEKPVRREKRSDPPWTGYRPRLYTGLVHSTGGDDCWPERGTLWFGCPQYREDPDIAPGLWQARIRVPVPEEMRCEKGMGNLKLRALLCHETALEPNAREFLLSFVKDEELFWEEIT